MLCSFELFADYLSFSCKLGSASYHLLHRLCSCSYWKKDLSLDDLLKVNDQTEKDAWQLQAKAGTSHLNVDAAFTLVVAAFTSSLKALASL